MATAPELLKSLPAVQIRAMTEADLEAVFAIERASYAFPWSEGIFRDCLRVGYVCRVFAVQGRVGGYGVMSMGAGEMHVLNLCISEQYRCRGLGRQMLEHLLDRGASAGMMDAFLEVRPSNAAALRLYRALGFQQIGMRRGYYQAAGGREDACVLKLNLRTRGAPNS